MNIIIVKQLERGYIMLSDNAKELIEFAHNLFDLSYDEIIKILEEAITYIEELKGEY